MTHDHHSQPYNPPVAYVPVGQQKNSLGILALVFGAMSFLMCGLVTGVPAIVLGHKSQQAEREGLANNGVLGKVGMIVGIIGTAMWFLVALIYIVPVLLTLAMVVPLTTM